MQCPESCPRRLPSGNFLNDKKLKGLKSIFSTVLMCLWNDFTLSLSKVDIKNMAMKLRIKDIKQKENVKMQLL